MLERTETGRTEDGEKFLEDLKKIMPPRISGLEVISAMGEILTSYVDGPDQAKLALVRLVEEVGTYYAALEAAECDCPKCTERRRKEIH